MDQEVNAGAPIQNVHERLAALGLTIPEPIVRPKDWKLLPYQVHGDLLYLSGHGPRAGDQVIVAGRLGQDLGVPEGKRAAQLCMLNLLSTVNLALGDLNRIKKVIKVFGMVRCTPDFHHQPEVLNGASELLINVFGDRGHHARTAVGMYDLPKGIAVEVEMIVAFA